jgi:hypothetical protein
VGDFDSDGVGDFAIGAPHEDGLAPNGGRILLYRGAVREPAPLLHLGGPSVAVPQTLRLMGTPSLAPLVLADLVPGPTPIPPFAPIELGASPAMVALNDPLGIFGVPFGLPLDSQGLFDIGPLWVPPSFVGTTIYLQAFYFTPAAPNGVFLRSNGVSITFAP